LNLQALLQPLLGPFIISWAPFIFKFVEGMSPGSVAGWRFLFGAALLAVLVKLKGQRFTRPNRFTYWAAAGLALDIFFWHKSIVLIGAGLATILANSQVIYMSLVSLRNGEYRSPAKVLIAAALGFAGIVLLFFDKIASSPASGSDLSWLDRFTRVEGIIFGVMAGILYTVFLLSFAKAEKFSKDGKVTQLVTLFWVSLLGGVGILGWESYQVINEDRAWSTVVPVTSMNLVSLLVLGLVIHVWGWLEIGKALRHFKKATIGLILLLQPLLVVIWSWIFFAEKLQGIQGVGALMIVSALAMIRLAGVTPTLKKSNGREKPFN
jgi:drug/metabolite transporter (DMT)-like permease